MRALLEIAGMAPGAIRFIPGELPGNDLAIVCMAGVAQHTGPVGLVESTLVRVGSNRRPCESGSMTCVARLGGHKVSCRFAGGSRAVVTGGTSARCHSSVAERRGDPGRRPVTAVAGLGCRDVGGALAPSGGAVMTGGTSARRDSSVAERGGGPSCCTVASIA